MPSRRGTTRDEQKEATRALLLQVARKVFTRHGYDGTSVATLCKAARVTHGALYHHFPGKADIFAAVLEELMTELAAKVRRGVEGTTGWDQVEGAVRAYLDACSDPAVMVIVFRDGPRALPTEVFNRIDQSINAPLVIGLLQGWIDAGLLRPFPAPLVAQMLGGAIAVAGAAIAEAGEGQAVRADAEAILLQWIGACRMP